MREKGIRIEREGQRERKNKKSVVAGVFQWIAITLGCLITGVQKRDVKSIAKRDLDMFTEKGKRSK